MVSILIGILFFGGGVFTSSSEFYYLTLVAGRIQRVYWRLGGPLDKRMFGFGRFPLSRWRAHRCHHNFLLQIVVYVPGDTRLFDLLKWDEFD